MFEKKDKMTNIKLQKNNLTNWNFLFITGPDIEKKKCKYTSAPNRKNRCPSPLLRKPNKEIELAGSLLLPRHMQLSYQTLGVFPFPSLTEGILTMSSSS